ncbi:MAG: tyrosine-type recombinase/integrase [Patescibacteria group bacterium]
MHISRAITEYLDWKRSYAVPASISYAPCLAAFEKHCSKEMTKIAQSDVTSFIASLPFKPRTIVYYVNILKDFFSYYRTEVNPKLIKRPKFTPEPVSFITEQEFRMMDKSLSEWEYYSLQKKLVINLLWSTGIRVSELCDLDVLDIKNTRHFAKIVTKKNRHMDWIMWSGKSHKLLMRYIGTKLCLDEHPALFTNRKGERITTRSVERWVASVATNAGIGHNVHPHMFRHGKAHKMLKDGAHLNDIKEVLRHRTIISTQMYTSLLPDEFKRLAKKYI